MVLINYFIYLLYFFLPIEQKITINSFKFYIPKYGKLGIYRAKYKNYDRFISLYVNCINDGVVIDIGANVGDSFFEMNSKNNRLEYILVEPEPYFFSLLRKNLKINNISKNCQIFDFFISSHKSNNLTLKKIKGTAKQIVADGNNKNEFKKISLDELISNLSNKKIKFIKIDVDGYDYDVINSGFNFISFNKPPLFFECDFKKSLTKDFFVTTINRLFKTGYVTCFLFDNYGNFYKELSDIKTINILFSKLQNDEFRFDGKKIYYFDILMVSQKDYLFAKNAVDSHI